VYEDGLHAQGLSNSTCVLTSSTTKARQHMGSSIIPLGGNDNKPGLKTETGGVELNC
jgi:hypothetical protein